LTDFMVVYSLIELMSMATTGAVADGVVTV
jgi:hypothetical protein